MKIKFNKSKPVQMNVRVSKDMEFKIKQIAKSEEVDKTEVIRALLEAAINEFFESKL